MFGNLPYCKVIVKTHTKNGMARFSHIVNAVLDFGQSLQPLHGKIGFIFQLHRIKIAHLFVPIFLPDNIHATVMHGCHKITGRDACRGLHPRQPFKHVQYYILGFAIILIGEKGYPAVKGIEVINDVCMKAMEMILKLSPIGVFCLLCPVIAENGAMIIGSLAKVLLVAYIGYILHAVIIYSIAVRTLGGMSIGKFFKNMLPAIMFAFSSASSVGTLPINLECCENMGASKEVASFVLPLGATINMDGTAIYQGVCSIFIASCYGIHLTFTQMLMIVATATLASIGTAGVPGAGMVMLAMVLQSVGLPIDGIALVAGVDRIFDMGRTTVNITGDASCVMVVSNLLRNKINSWSESE